MPSVTNETLMQPSCVVIWLTKSRKVWGFTELTCFQVAHELDIEIEMYCDFDGSPADVDKVQLFLDKMRESLYSSVDTVCWETLMSYDVFKTHCVIQSN